MARVASTYRQVASALSARRPSLASSVAAHWGDIARALVNSVQFGSALGQLLDLWSPSCVVSTSDFWPFEHQLYCKASTRKIPSVVIQHGTVSEFWWPFVADLYLLWGHADAEEMQRFGAPQERLAIAGMPATDKLFAQNSVSRPEKSKDPRRPVCLILSNTHGTMFEPEIFDKYRQFLAQAVNLLPSATWKVKLHPAESDIFYRNMGSSIFERFVFYPRQTSLQDAVADADVVTTIYSTAGLEAMIMGRPLVIAPLTPRVREFAPWPATGGGTYASSAEDFQIQFNRLVSDPDYRAQQLGGQGRFLSDHFANPGCSAERIVDLLERKANMRFSYSEARGMVSTPVTSGGYH